ncbi:MAG: protein kinase [Deltaproteobacteria bacterium]|nr:protein kinase [Deltaproteobacteria bacterium]
MHLDNRYKIIEKVGSGGMATVYRARDELLNREVAIKVLHPHLVEKEDVKKRFLREAQALARLKHKNIIEVFDYFSEESNCYIVSEFIKGKNLASFISEYDISSPFIAAMIVSILADAIDHAHKNNVIHRDIKPENILISDNYQLKITDFGIAYITDAESLTITGSISGSPAHMSPEQIDGKDIDLRTDIFSLGTILYLISCGELPFKGNSPASIFKSILMGEYKDPREVNPIIDSRFASIIHKCLKKDLNERYGSCEELKTDLIIYLKKYGITEIELSLQAFFKNPISFFDELNHKIAKHLKDYLYKNIRDNNTTLEIQEYLNILLHLVPEDHDAKALFDRFLLIEESKKNKLKRLKYGILGLTIISLILTSIYWKDIFYNHKVIYDDWKNNNFTDSQKTSNLTDTDTGQITSENNYESNEEPVKTKVPEHLRDPTEHRKKRNKVIQSLKKGESLKTGDKDTINEVKSGELNLYIKPYGDVYINNNLVGTEKATLNLKLRSGRHFIRVKNPFFFDIEREINIEPDSKVDLRLVFDKIKPAKLFILSPQECDIYIDGNLLGQSSMFINTGITIPIHDATDGKREIILKASRAGYRDFIKKIELTAGETRSIKIHLVKGK